MSFTNISQISDISTISHCSTGRIIRRVDSLQSLFEHHCSFVQNASTAASFYQGVNHLDRIGRSFGLCEESISDLIKNEVVFDCLVEATSNSNKSMSMPIVQKLRGILLMYELGKYLHLPRRSAIIQEELIVLGITDIPKYELTCEEKLEVKCLVESLLRKKLNNFTLRYESMGGNIKDVLRGADCNARNKFFETSDLQKLQWTDKIEELCMTYESDVKRYRRLINKWTKLKYNDMHNIYLKRAENLLLKAEVVLEQAKITTLSCYMKMFKETPITLNAFQMLNAILDAKLKEVVNETTDKINLKKQYDTLHNTEYDEILKTYIDICKAIEKKKQILQSL